MLQKTKSRQTLKWKYILLVPIIIGMLFYTSCQFEESISENDDQTITVSNINQLTLEEEIEIMTTLEELNKSKQDWELYLQDQELEVKFVSTTDDSYISGLNGERISAKMFISSNADITIADIFGKSNVYDGVPFAAVEEAPVFPGCENDNDPRACFNTMIQKHISKNFRYPEEAQKQGIQGRVSVMFVITKDGSIQGLKMRGPHKILEDEVTRIINKLPQMQPGKANGKAVNVPFSIPINFKLEDGGFNDFSNNTDGSKIGGEPMVIIDGKESSKEEMLKIDSETIESIDVFKDEEAINRYGSKGKNGIIVVKLKKEN